MIDHDDALGGPRLPGATRRDFPCDAPSPEDDSSTVLFLQSTLESAADGIVVVEHTGRILAYNQRFATLWRLPPGLLDRRDHAGIHAFVLEQLADPGHAADRILELFENPEDEGFDVLELKDGRVFERYSIPQRLGGALVGRVWSYRDVTDRRRAEEALRQSEEKYREILGSISEGYYEVSLRGDFTFVNDALCRITGYTHDELIGMNNRSYTERETSRKLFQAFHGVYLSGESGTFLDWEILRKDKTPRTVEASVALIRDRAGKPVGFRGVVRDVTERKLAERALRESEERYRGLVELSPDAVAIHSEGRIVFCSQAGARLLGYSRPEELIGRSALEFVHPDSRPMVAERVRQVLTDGRPLPFVEERFLRKDGSGAEVEVGAVPFTLHHKPAVQVIIRDISERKRAERLQSALFRIAQTTSSLKDMASFYAEIHSVLAELMYARNLYIALLNETTQTLTFPYFVDQFDRPPAPRRLGRGLSEYVLRTGEPLLASSATFAELREEGAIELIGSPSVDWLGVPLKKDERTFGVLAVQSYTEEIRFTPADRELLTFVSQHVATAIDRKRADDDLRASESRFRTLAETAPFAIFIYQGASLVYANRAMAAMTGYDRDTLVGMEFWQFVHPDHQDLIRDRGLARQRGGEVPSSYEFKIVKKDGEMRWVAFSAALIELDGKPAGLGTAFDITDRKKAEEQIRSLAYHDGLTGLPNRLLFHDRLSMAVASAHRHQHKLAVLFLDLDRFKLINDSLGHSLGDELLQAVGDRLEGSIREGDTVARLGGDEFTLLLPELVRGSDAAKVAGKVLEALKQPFHVGGRELYVTASVGVAVYPHDGQDAEALVKNADTAMYRAKEQGRDNYQLYTATMNASAIERLALENALRKAVAQRCLEVHYQPQLDFRADRVYGVEALVRWRHPERGLVPPSEFIGLAEVSGLILPIGHWVLRTACVQAKAWHENGHRGLKVGVNLSARQLQAQDVVDQIRGILEDSGLDPASLDLEITETNAMQNADATVTTLRQLKALGVSVSIDDFGIGYSSLNYLKRLPIDTLKIDQSFVRDVTTDPDDAAIATAIIALAHTLKLTVVAEGVETRDQLAFLASRGCHRMQGFLFSGALEAAECESFLLRHRR